jgi:hypothetical protein
MIVMKLPHMGDHSVVGACVDKDTLKMINHPHIQISCSGATPDEIEVRSRLIANDVEWLIKNRITFLLEFVP